MSRRNTSIKSAFSFSSGDIGQDSMSINIQNHIATTNGQQSRCKHPVPLPIFHAQARQALTIVWPDVSPNSIQLSHVCGGANNRIIGVTRPSTKGDGQQPDHFVVRVPNHDAGFRETVAAFIFADRYAKLTTPSTVHFDLGDSNPFGNPYLVQNRLPGMSAADVPFWRDHGRKLRFWSDYGAIFCELLQVRSSVIGACDFSIVGDGSAPSVHSRVGVRDRGTGAVWRQVPLKSVMPSKTAIRDYLLRDFERYKGVSARLASHMCRACQPIRLAHITAFTKLIHEAHDDGWFEGMAVTLRHVDLWPSNVLVAEDGSITGVLDWDGAMLEPAFMACEPPEMYWTCGMNLSGRDSQTKRDELKRAFNESAGTEYSRFAYGEAYNFLRKIVGFRPMYWCCCANPGHYDMDEIIRDWNGIRMKRVGKPSEAKIAFGDKDQT
ncbi:hypothetical protein ACRALDRAFT_205927 [Sodiomyces alcalophilus JCM 7366]|uniref:uncharacterized protein n=1 Tax=Sodiomyces alcalophilus JCM 7366 TaxID=591952 RepID=UPI0039B62956